MPKGSSPSGIWRLNTFYGGISTGSKRGVGGSFSIGQGLDFRTDSDILQANYAMVKDSSTNVTGLIKWFTQYGTTIYAYASDGKIHSNASSWTSLRTVSSSSGQGLCTFTEGTSDYLYYTQNAQLGRYGDLKVGGTTFTDNYQALTTDTLWHPMKVFLNLLCIGNGNTLATLDNNSVFTAAKITLPTGWKIKSLEIQGDMLQIGAWKGTAITDFEQGALFRWDGIATTWYSVEFINESGVNALINQNDALFAFPGTTGNMYQVGQGNFVKIKRVPNIGAGKVAEVYPGAVTTFNGLIHFGTAGSTTSTTMLQGVYTWGSVEKNYPPVLNFAYPISTGTTSGTGLSIGAVYGASPTALYVGWKDGATYGIDLLSTNTLQTTVFYESLIYDANAPYLPKEWQQIRLLLKPFVASESVVIKYKADRASSYTTLTLSSGTLSNTGYYIYPFNNSTGFIRANEMQIRIELNSGAQLIEADVFFTIDAV